MPKRDSKKSGKKDKAAAGAAEAVEAVRAAVERTFTASAEGAKSTRGRAKDVTVAANRIREVLEDRVLEEIKGLRRDVEGLGNRVSALERGPRRGRSPTRASRSAAAKPTNRVVTSAAKKSSGSTRSSASTARKPTTARKPAASRSATARKTSSTGRRPATSTRSSGGTSADGTPSSGAGGTTSGS